MLDLFFTHWLIARKNVFDYTRTKNQINVSRSGKKKCDGWQE